MGPNEVVTKFIVEERVFTSGENWLFLTLTKRKNHSLWFTCVNSAACPVIEVLSGKKRGGKEEGKGARARVRIGKEEIKKREKRRKKCGASW